MRKKKCLTTLTFQIYDTVYETGDTIKEKKSVTQKDLKIIVIKRIKVKIKIKNKLEGEKNQLED